MERESRLLDLDIRGLIGLMSVAGLFGVVFTQLGQGVPVTIPPEVAGTVGATIGFYFGGKGAGVGNEAVQAAQGMRLEEIHALVNSRLDEALSTIADQKVALADLTAALRQPKGGGAR